MTTKNLEVIKVPLNRIKPNPFNERKTLGDISTLVNKMKQKGFWGALLARPKGNNYELAFGERRIAAARRAGLTEVPLTIKEMDDKEMMENTTVENVLREGVDPIERAKHFAEYQRKYKPSLRQMADVFGLADTTISELLELLQMRGPSQKLVSSNTIGWTQATKAFEVGGDEFVKVAAKKQLFLNDIRAIADAVKKFPDQKAKLLKGDTHPDDLEVRMLRQEPISAGKLANKIASFLLKAGQALDLYEEHKDEMGIVGKTNVKAAITLLKKKLSNY